MRMVRDTTGRFALRPHFSSDELDAECEQIITSFLVSRYGEARFPVSTEDLATLIEKEAEDLDQYADLSEFGPGVEGVTIFCPGQRPRVKVSATLAEDRGRENRLRTTLTHEYGHVRLHASLFDVPQGTADLFGTAGEPAVRANGNNIQICKRDTIVGASASDWMEWQAGHVCGAILMPASAVRALVKKFLDDEGGGAPFTGRLGTQVVEEVRSAYQVSTQAAEVRLTRLGLLSDDYRPRRLL